ncbi:CS1-pili formation C-terminal domain-containing protein [Aliivibrio fischeri]|uniref:CS1-pili formation C-terminal domain-containing protein n=1 Tax=Aliivibrio fischeri TaxID=668 RepID=UPI00080EA0F3|nr:CS1-pili formation C-terminal domain-containing protein [Aliivibrio fischeri]OCH48154.1 hypothetical protein A6E02_08470 [Aliivibrio fischeri]
MIFRVVFLFFILILNPNYCLANYIPEEFKHFYVYEKNNIIFELPNQVEVNIVVESNFKNIRKIINIEQLNKALIDSGIKKKYLNSVIKKITANDDEVTSSDGIITKFDSELKKLTLTVPPGYMSNKRRYQGYTNAEPKSKSLITTNRLYTNVYNGSASSTLNNKTILGLGKGYFEMEGSLTSNSQSSSSKLQKTGYTYNFNGSSIEASYSRQSNLIDNATSNFDYNHGGENYKLAYFSNDNLLIKDERNAKKLYFDMKSTGTVNIERDGATIYSNSAGRGQQSINYKQLPKGNYNAVLILRPDGYKEERQSIRIINNTSRTSERGYDYSVSINNANFESRNNDKYISDYVDLALVKSLYDDKVIFGSNLQISDDDIHAGFGVKYNSTNLSLGIYSSQLNDGRIYNLNANIYGLNIDYEELDLKDRAVTDLTAVRFGDNSYNQVTISYAMPLFSGYLSSFLNKYNEVDDVNNGIDNLSLSVNYHETIFKNIGLDIGYTINHDYLGSNYSESILTTNISIPLGHEFEYSSGVDYSTNSKFRLANTIQYNDDLITLGDVEVSGGANMSEYIDSKNSELAVGGHLNINNDKFTANAYANVSDSGYRNFSANAETTTVFVEGDVYSTVNQSKSYLLMENDVKNKKEYEDLGLVDIQINHGGSSRKNLKGDYTLIGLNDYSNYNFKLDTEVSGYQSVDKKAIGSMFSYPGSVNKVNNKLKEVVSFLTYFEDFNKEPLNNVKCVGDGCVSISRVGDGIFNISITKDEVFKITSNNQVCLVGNEHIENLHGDSRCFPQIEEDSTGMQLVKSGLGRDDDVIYYLGIIGDEIPRDFKLKIAAQGIEVLEYDFDEKTHLFAKLNSKNQKSNLDIAQQLNSLSEIQRYANYEQNNNKFTVIRK